MSTGQVAILKGMADGSRLTILKQKGRAELKGEKVNLLTFHALKDKKLIQLDMSDENVALWRLTKRGKEFLNGQEEA